MCLEELGKYLICYKSILFNSAFYILKLFRVQRTRIFVEKVVVEVFHESAGLGELTF
jgi:hypothetical protein